MKKLFSVLFALLLVCSVFTFAQEEATEEDPIASLEERVVALETTTFNFSGYTKFGYDIDNYWVSTLTKPSFLDFTFSYSGDNYGFSTSFGYDFVADAAHYVDPYYGMGYKATTGVNFTAWMSFLDGKIRGEFNFTEMGTYYGLPNRWYEAYYDAWFTPVLKLDLTDLISGLSINVRTPLVDGDLENNLYDSYVNVSYTMADMFTVGVKEYTIGYDGLDSEIMFDLLMIENLTFTEVVSVVNDAELSSLQFDTTVGYDMGMMNFSENFVLDIKDAENWTSETIFGIELNDMINAKLTLTTTALSDILVEPFVNIDVAGFNNILEAAIQYVEGTGLNTIFVELSSAFDLAMFSNVVRVGLNIGDAAWGNDYYYYQSSSTYGKTFNAESIRFIDRTTFALGIFSNTLEIDLEYAYGAKTFGYDLSFDSVVSTGNFDHTFSIAYGSTTFGSFSYLGEISF